MTVTAPDVTVWWDPAAVTAAALDQLRLTDTDVDAGRVADAVAPAGQKVNQYLDRDPADAFTVAAAPPDLIADLVQVVVEEYRRKDAPPTSIDGMIGSSWRPQSFDTLAGVRASIGKHRTRLGMG